MPAELPSENFFIEQSRRDLSSGVPPSVVLTYARHHIGAMKALAPSDDRDRKIAEAEKFADDLEAKGVAG